MVQRSGHSSDGHLLLADGPPPPGRVLRRPRWLDRILRWHRTRTGPGVTPRRHRPVRGHGDGHDHDHVGHRDQQFREPSRLPAESGGGRPWRSSLPFSVRVDSVSMLSSSDASGSREHGPPRSRHARWSGRTATRALVCSLRTRRVRTRVLLPQMASRSDASETASLPCQSVQRREHPSLDRAALARSSNSRPPGRSGGSGSRRISSAPSARRSSRRPPCGCTCSRIASSGRRSSSSRCGSSSPT